MILEATGAQLVLMFFCHKKWEVGCKIGERWDVTSLHGHPNEDEWYPIV